MLLPFDDEHAPLYTVGQVADMLGVQPAFLRRVDLEAVVQPARSEGGQRRYNRHDIGQVQRVSAMAGEGMTLVGIRRILALEAEVGRGRRPQTPTPQSARCCSEGPLNKAVSPQRRTTRPGVALARRAPAPAVGVRASAGPDDPKRRCCPQPASSCCRSMAVAIASGVMGAASSARRSSSAPCTRVHARQRRRDVEQRRPRNGRDIAGEDRGRRRPRGRQDAWHHRRIVDRRPNRAPPPPPTPPASAGRGSRPRRHRVHRLPFVAGLAFTDAALGAQAKIGIVAASLLASILGAILRPPTRPPIAQTEMKEPKR